MAAKLTRKQSSSVDSTTYRREKRIAYCQYPLQTKRRDGRLLIMKAHQERERMAWIDT